MSNVQSASLTIIATEIKSNLLAAQVAYMTVGKLLTEAREEFTKASDFYQWANDAVNLKKSMVCRLVAVFKAYQKEEWATTLSVNALETLLKCDDEVKEVVKSEAKAGKPMTDKEIKKLDAEVKGEEPKPATKPATKPEVSTTMDKTVKQVEDEATKAAIKAEQTQKKLLAQVEASNKQKDITIKANRVLMKENEELKEAQANYLETICKQAQRIKELEKQIADQKDSDTIDKAVKMIDSSVAGANTYAELLEEVISEVGQQDDLPWEDSTEVQDLGQVALTEEETKTDDAQLAIFGELYTELQNANPRALVSNTVEAAEQAGIEVQGTGRKQQFILASGSSYTGKDLRLAALN